MTFNHTRRAIYGAGMKKWSSYLVKSPEQIEHHSSHAMNHLPEASSPDTKTRAIFVLAAQKPPYLVYGNPFYDYAGYGNVFSVDDEGGLQENVQNYEYQPNSAIHGMVFDANEEYLYSADMWANKIWTHRKVSLLTPPFPQSPAPTLTNFPTQDMQTGHLTLVSSNPAPAPTDHPRWVEIHPSGKTLYALMESGNRLSSYNIPATSPSPIYTGVSYPLVPPGLTQQHPKMYRSDVCFLSSSAKFLFATSRSNSPELTGYLAVFELDGEGVIVRQLALMPTPTSGGHSNAVSPCPWSDEWLALCDDEKGFVEMYRWDGEFLSRVAHLDVKEPGFGMNAIWYD